MTINVGDRLPDAKFMTMGPEGPVAKSTADIFSGKKVALFAVPGAFTPTCHKAHLPGFVDRAGELKGFTGIDDPYEAPAKPELVLDAGTKDAETLADEVIAYLERSGKIK